MRESVFIAFLLAVEHGELGELNCNLVDYGHGHVDTRSLQNAKWNEVQAEESNSDKLMDNYHF